MPTDSFLSSFFWNSKVTSTRSAEANAGQEWDRRRLFLKKRKFLTLRIWVRLLSLLVVFEYSHERIQKKKARQASVARASGIREFWILAMLRIFRRTDTGIAFCCFGEGSVFL